MPPIEHTAAIARGPTPSERVSSPTTAPPSSSRKRESAPGVSASVATRIAVATMSVLAVVCAVVVVQLTNRERLRLVSAKTDAASMVVDLFAASISPGVDFADEQAIGDGLSALARNREVTYAGVWLEGAAAPSRAIGTPPADRSPGAPESGEKTEVSGDHIDLTRPIASPGGATIGRTFVRVSLARENAALESARLRILGASLGVCAAIAALLIALMQRLVTTPLGRLERAANQLRKGDLTLVPETADDELGRLAGTFNRMARAIEDRERKLEQAGARLQGVLDHMGQGILVFGKDGKVASVRSKLADTLFDHPIREGDLVQDLLYPPGASTRVERDAFAAWLDAAFAGDTPLDIVAELAPPEVTLGTGESTRTLSLEFRPAPSEDGTARVLLLATDQTERRALERNAELKDQAHERRLTAMRRLAAGGPQTFVNFIAGAKARLDRSLELVKASSLPRSNLEAIFQHVHTLRSEARSFALTEVESALVAAEGLLVTLRDPAQARNSAQTALLRDHVASARDALDRAEALFVEASPIGRAVLSQVPVSRDDVEKLSTLVAGADTEVARVVRRLAARPFGESVHSLPESFERWTEQENKLAHLHIEGREVMIPGALAQVLSSVLGHLVRNAIAHGVESPGDRERSGKLPAGLVRVACTQGPTGPVVSVDDDGGGFHIAELRQRASALGVLGAASKTESLAFEPGITTTAAPNELSGYGVGLGAVRAELDRAFYTVQLSSKEGVGSRIELRPKEQ